MGGAWPCSCAGYQHEAQRRQNGLRQDSLHGRGRRVRLRSAKCSLGSVRKSRGSRQERNASADYLRGFSDADRFTVSFIEYDAENRIFNGASSRYRLFPVALTNSIWCNTAGQGLISSCLCRFPRNALCLLMRRKTLSSDRRYKIFRGMPNNRWQLDV